MSIVFIVSQSDWSVEKPLVNETTLSDEDKKEEKKVEKGR